MKGFRERTQNLYWRQLFVTAGMVLLTLCMLGASFFSLSYNYARSQQGQEIATKAQVMSQLSLSYLESGRYLDIEDLQDALDFQRLASFAAIVSDVQFMICDTEGHVLLSTDEALDGKTVTIPPERTRQVMEQGSASWRDDLGGLYPQKRFSVGVAAVGEPAVGYDAAGKHVLLWGDGLTQAEVEAFLLEHHPRLWRPLLKLLAVFGANIK